MSRVTAGLGDHFHPPLPAGELAPRLQDVGLGLVRLVVRHGSLVRPLRGGEVGELKIWVW